MFEDLKLDLKLKWLRSLLGKKVGLGYHDNVLHYNDIVSISSTYSDIPVESIQVMLCSMNRKGQGRTFKIYQAQKN